MDACLELLLNNPSPIVLLMFTSFSLINSSVLRNGPF